MKKLISLLLVFVLCFSICACGKENAQEYITEQSIPEIEPAESAVPEEPAAPAEPAGHSAILSKFMPILCGDWEVLYRNDVELVDAISFSEDGTLTIGNQSFSWEILSESSSDLLLNVSAGGKGVGYVGFEMRDNEPALFVSLNEYDYPIYFYQPSCYETISVTTDNWQEYFEIRQSEAFLEDAFDDATAVHLTWKLCLKEEYYDRISHIIMDDPFDEAVVDTGAVEYSFDYGTKSFSVDFDNRTFSFEDDFAPTDSDTAIAQFGLSDDTFYAILSGFYIYKESVESDATYIFMDNYEFTRMKLDLYLIAE